MNEPNRKKVSELIRELGAIEADLEVMLESMRAAPDSLFSGIEEMKLFSAGRSIAFAIDRLKGAME